MICPRCGREISDSETLCPFCFQDINKNVEFNDYRKDGFIQIRVKDESDTSTAINYAPKYFELSELSMLVIAVVFILFVATLTLFSLKFVQKTNRAGKMITVIATPDEATEATTEEITEPPTPNYIENISIKNLYGTWKLQSNITESETRPLPYYTFSPDGTAAGYYGTVSMTGTFKDLSEGDYHRVYINIESGLRGTFDFSLIANEDKTKTLILSESSSSYYSTTYFVSTDTAKIVTMHPDDSASYSLDENLFGFWVNKEKDKNYEFNKDGTVSRGTGNVTTKGVWKLKDENKINIQYIKGSLKSIDLQYLQKGNKLKINNVVYYKTAKKD